MSKTVQGGKQVLVPILIALVISGIAIGSVVILSQHRSKKVTVNTSEQTEEVLAPKMLDIVTQEKQMLPSFVYTASEIQGNQENYQLNATLSNIVNRRELRLSNEEIMQLRNEYILFGEKKNTDLLSFYAQLDEQFPTFLSSEAVLEQTFAYLSLIQRDVQDSITQDFLPFLQNILAISQAQYTYTTDTSWHEAAKRNMIYVSVIRTLLDDEASIPAEVKEEVQSELSSLSLQEEKFHSQVYLDDFSDSIDLTSYPRKGSHFEKAMWYASHIRYDMKSLSQQKSAILLSLAMQKEADNAELYKKMQRQSQLLPFQFNDKPFEITAKLEKAFGKEFDIRRVEVEDTLDELFRKENSWTFVNTFQTNIWKEMGCAHASCPFDVSILQYGVYLNSPSASTYLTKPVSDALDQPGSYIHNQKQYILSDLFKSISKNIPVFQTKLWERKELHALGSLAFLEEKRQWQNTMSLENVSKHTLAFVEPDMYAYERLSAYLDFVSSLLESQTHPQHKENVGKMKEYVDMLMKIAKKEIQNEEVSEEEMNHISSFSQVYKNIWERVKEFPLPNQGVFPLYASNTHMWWGLGPVQELFIVVPIDDDYYIAKGGMYTYVELEKEQVDDLTQTNWISLWEKRFEKVVQEWQKPFIQ